MPEAARVNDKHACPCPAPVAHVGGPIDPPCATNVETNLLGAARATDKATCTGVPAKNFIVTGSMTVEINGKMAARKTDFTMHPGPGVIIEGSGNVEIGGPRGGATLGNPAQGEQMCQNARAGRHTPGNIQQSYQNCGVESTRQIINQATGGNISEDALLDDALSHGDAQTVTKGKWPFRTTDRANSGGTWSHSWPAIAGRHGVPMHNEAQNLQNLGQVVAEGRGVVTAHDVSVLWGPGQSGGHAITVTGMEYDDQGRPKTVIYNDTGMGQCSARLPAAQFQQSFLGGFTMGVTDAPIFK